MDSVLENNEQQAWNLLSMPAQMVNIGNEIKRAFRFSDPRKRERFFDTAVKYINLSCNDKKNSGIITELKIGLDVVFSLKNDEHTPYKQSQVVNYYLNFAHYL